MARSIQLPIPAGQVVRVSTQGVDADRGYGVSLTLFNSGTVAVELGGSDVSAANSFRGMDAGSTLGLDLGADEELFARVSGGTAGLLDVLEVR